MANRGGRESRRKREAGRGFCQREEKRQRATDEEAQAKRPTGFLIQVAHGIGVTVGVVLGVAGLIARCIGFGVRLVVRCGQ